MKQRALQLVLLTYIWYLGAVQQLEFWQGGLKGLQMAWETMQTTLAGQLPQNAQAKI